jgi:FixJ family two-component response regulator
MRSGTFMVHVIDDDDAVRESLEALLLVSGYAVETYGSAEAYLVRPARDGCVLLDMHMPGMNGIQLLEHLARGNRHVPVLVLTASREERLRERALALGVLAYLSKPVSEASLLAAVRKAEGTAGVGRGLAI